MPDPLQMVLRFAGAVDQHPVMGPLTKGQDIELRNLASWSRKLTAQINGHSAAAESFAFLALEHNGVPAGSLSDGRVSDD